MVTVRRGEVWLTQLDPPVGSEIQKIRPCLVVSPDFLHGGDTCAIVPLTSGSRRTRFRHSVTFQGQKGLMLPDQLRFVSRQRMIRRLDDAEPADVEVVLRLIRLLFTP